MGFFLTLLYIVTAYLGPATIYEPLADLRIGLILAVLVLLVSVPALAGSIIWKTSQSLALVGLAFATFLSLLATGWAGGGVQVFLDFIPNAFAYYLVCLHCNTKRRLQILILLILGVCLFDIAMGYNELRNQPPISADSQETPSETPYLMPQRTDSGQWIFRIRGQDFINDPNDFAQLVLCWIPLTFFFWRPKKKLANLVFVLLPVSGLLFGVFLTHSRGAVLAILAMTVVAARRRIKTIPALLLAGVLFVAAMSMQVTGGRDISVGSGEDRTALWGESLELLKAHPLFGIGFGQLPDYLGYTAHNSVAVCAAELGSIGLFFWSLFLFPTVRDALTTASPTAVSEGNPIEPEKVLFPRPMKKVESIDKAEINRLGRLVVFSLTGFLVAGWFLSRAFVMTLFLLGGIAEVVFEMALERGMVSPRLPLARQMRYAAGLAISLIVLMYIMLRIMNLTR